MCDEKFIMYRAQMVQPSSHNVLTCLIVTQDALVMTFDIAIVWNVYIWKLLD